jgi:curli biogenesis system outer membrane secretion channel CsgG
LAARFLVSVNAGVVRRATVLRFRPGPFVAATVVLLLGGGVAGCQRASDEAEAPPAAPAKPVIAVARFELPVPVVIPEWEPIETNFLHDQTIQSLVHTGAFDVVERTRLEKILAEQQLTKEAITDPARAAALGKVLGAGYFVLGSLKDVGLERRRQPLPYTQRVTITLSGRMRVDVRVVDVESSRIAASDTADVVLERDLIGGPQDAAEARQLFAELQEETGRRVALLVTDALVPVTVAGVEGARVELNRGAATGVQTGEIFDVLGTKEEWMGSIRVTDSAEGHSLAEVVDRGGDIGVGMHCRRPRPAPTVVRGRPDPLEDRW